MNKIGAVVYWGLCLYLFREIVQHSNWQNWVDAFSFEAVLLPALASFLLTYKQVGRVKLRRFIQIAWLSGAWVSLCSVIIVFNENHQDLAVMQMGLGVALLPLFYALLLSLLLVPFYGDLSDARHKMSEH